jgi:ketosteroid isomerase-like protein
MRKSLPLFVLIFLLVTSLFLTVKRADARSDAATPNRDARKAVDNFNRRFVENCRNMNNKAASEMWAEDGVDLLPGMDAMVGKAAISKWQAGLEEQSKGAKVTQCDVDWQKIELFDETAYEWGINTQTVSLPDKPEPFRNKGKITLILHRQSEGEWKLALESWNSSPQK